jgi:hypothetical protein
MSERDPKVIEDLLIIKNKLITNYQLSSETEQAEKYQKQCLKFLEITKKYHVHNSVKRTKG